jgi:hypothetical protein
LEESFSGSHLYVIANNHKIFADIAVEAMAENMARPSLIYDFWNNFTAQDLNLPEGTGYAGLGSQAVSKLPQAIGE